METQVLDYVSAVAGLFDPKKITLIFFSLTCFWVINQLIRKSCVSAMARIPSKRFLILQIATLFTFSWYFFAVYWILAVIIRPPSELVLGLIGSIAVAVGIALKDIAASVIAGLMLLFERPFQVGDRVSFNGTYGEIMRIGLRSVRLNTLNDDLVTIPNSVFITQAVSTSNAGALEMMVTWDFHLALDANIDKAQLIIHEVIVTSLYVYMKKPIKFVVYEAMIAERLAITLCAKAYVFDVRYEKNFQTDVYKRTSQLFAEQDIKRPVR